MKIALVAMLSGFLLAVIIPFRFRVHYLKDGKDDFLSVTWLVLPDIFFLSLEIPFMKISPSRFPPVIHFRTQLEGPSDHPMNEKKHRIEVDWKMLLQTLKSLPRLLSGLERWKKITLWLLHRTSLDRFIVKTRIGTGDAAETGIIIGITWSLLSNIYLNLPRLFRRMPSRPVLNVLPNFQQPFFSLDIDCIFKIAGGHIIIGGIKMLLIFLAGKYHYLKINKYKSSYGFRFR